MSQNSFFCIRISFFSSARKWNCIRCRCYHKNHDNLLRFRTCWCNYCAQHSDWFIRQKLLANGENFWNDFFWLRKNNKTRIFCYRKKVEKIKVLSICLKLSPWVYCIVLIGNLYIERFTFTILMIIKLSKYCQMGDVFPAKFAKKKSRTENERKVFPTQLTQFACALPFPLPPC